MDRDERELFEHTVRSLTEQHTGDDLDAALVELGWRDALADDPEAAVGALFDAQGRAGARSSALAWLLADQLGVGDDVAVAHPAPATANPPGRIEGGRLHVTGLLTSVPAGATRLAMAASDGGAIVVAAVPIDAFDITPIGGIDPSSGVRAVSGSGPAEVLGEVDWAAATRICRLAVAHELVGASRQMLELARLHAIERQQFGVAIASFQAVRHRLADTLVAIEMAEAAVDAAWLDRADHHALIAKAVAGRSSRLASKHAQQVLAGIGYTLEHPFHGYARRVLVLDEFYGSSTQLTRELGTQLLATGELPPLLPL